jgi:hypothetical protein
VRYKLSPLAIFQNRRYRTFHPAQFNGLQGPFVNAGPGRCNAPVFPRPHITTLLALFFIILDRKNLLYLDTRGR